MCMLFQRKNGIVYDNGAIALAWQPVFFEELLVCFPSHLIAQSKATLQGASSAPS